MECLRAAERESIVDAFKLLLMFSRHFDSDKLVLCWSRGGWECCLYGFAAFSNLPTLCTDLGCKMSGTSRSGR